MIDSFRHENGKVVEVCRGQEIEGWEHFPPGEVVAGMLWDGETLSIPQPPEPTLAEVKAQALAALASARWEATQYFTYDGVRTQADNAVAVITGRITLRDKTGIPPEYPMGFKLGDGQFRQWAAADEVAFGAAIAGHIQDCFDVEATATLAIEAAEDAAEVAAALEAVVWPA